TTTCGSTGTGTCTASCTLPVPAACTPPAEVCNGVDDDCDGVADNGFACVRGAAGIPCTTTCGSTGTGTCTASCTVPAPAACTPPAEVCNGVDDDCDGVIDNGNNACNGACALAAQPGAPCDSPDDLDDCADDVYVCDGRNAVRCAKAGVDADGDGYSAGPGACHYDCDDTRADVYPGAPEACNGRDDNCDGQIDEGTGFAPLPLGMMVLMDGPCPAGWSEVTAARGRLLRGSNGDAVYAETGGADAPHTHTLTSHTHTTGSTSMPSHTHVATLDESTASVVAAWFGSGTTEMALTHSHAAPVFDVNDRAAAHTHAISSDLASTQAGGILPPYREYVLCENARDDVYAVPAGAVALGEGACPHGWAEETALRGRMVRGEDGDGQYSQVAGSATHPHGLTHNHGAFTANSDGTSFHYHGGPYNSGFADSHIPFLNGTAGTAWGYHTHQVSMSPDATHRHSVVASGGASDPGSHVPPYREALFCRAPAAVCPVDSTVAFFTEACPTGWSELTQYRNVFLRGEDGNGVPDETGGSAQHSHGVPAHNHNGATTSDAHNHPVGTGGPSSTRNVPAGTWGSFASDTHRHTGTTTMGGAHSHTVSNQPAGGVTGTTANNPAWFEVVVCRRDSGGQGCGDGQCTGLEDCASCPADCGACAVAPAPPAHAAARPRPAPAAGPACWPADADSA
ncbi:MAG TPA: putative metal-binding motif-containing protein, partial [Polyangia bacterium]